MAIRKALRRLQETFSPRRPVRPRARRFDCEQLEDRTLLSILFGNNPNWTVSDNNGPVLANAQVRLIFWGNGWNSGSGPALRTQLQNAIDTLNTSTYFYSPLPGADLSQYRPGTQSRPTRVASFSTTYLSPGTTFTTQNVIDMLSHEYGMTPGFFYYVVPDPNSTPTGCGCAALHTYWSQGGNREYFGYSRNLATPSIDDLSYLYSHEMVESITDPDGSALQVDPRNPNSWNEISDGEAQNYAYRVNGIWAQSYWSRANGRFTVPTGQSQNFFVSGGAPGSRVLTINGDQLGNRNDAITLDVNGGVRVTLNGEVAQFDAGQIGSVVVNALTGADTITVVNSVGGMPVTINAGADVDTVNVLRNNGPLTIDGGGGLDNVNIGNAGSLAGIAANILVRNPPGGGYSALTIDTSAFAGSYTATISDTAVSFGGATISYVQSDLRSLTLRGGSGGSTYNITNTPNSGAPGGMVTSVLGGGSVDTMNVLRTGGRLVINGGGGLDNVNIGNAGSLAGILAAIDVSNPPGGGYTALTVDTSAFAGTYTATLSDTSISFGGAPINYAAGDLRSLTLRGGTGGSTYNITNTPFSGFGGGMVTSVLGGGGVDTMNVLRTGSRLVINGGGGLDNVNVGNAGSLTGILAAIDVSNPPGGGYTALTINNQADAVGRTISVSSSAVSFGGVPINFVQGDMRALTVNAGTGADTFNVPSTPISSAPGGMVTTLNGGDGVDLFNIGVGQLAGIMARVHLDGQAGGGTAVVSDAANATAREDYRWNGSALLWSGTTLEAANLSSLLLLAGLGDDVVAILPGAGVPFSYNGSGGANALDYSGYNTDVYVNFNTGVATGTVAITNMQYVLGGPGNDLLVGAGNNVLAGGPGRDVLIGGAAPSVLFGDFFEDLGDDIVIAGSTIYDTNDAALLAIRDYWAGGDDYDTRVANLTTGTGVPLLDASTITYNGGPNLLLGGGGRDLFFINPGIDVLIDPEDGEVVISL